jgi:hypothetical protein
MTTANQILFKAITGYNVQSAFSDARDDYYFDNCKTDAERLQQLENYWSNVLDECEGTPDFQHVLEKIKEFEEASSTSDKYYVYDSIK